MYRYFLALRYLINRPINLLGTIGIMLGVWSLIVVVSIFSGYLGAVEEHLRSSTADLSVIEPPETIPFEILQRAIEADENVLACSPRLLWYGLLHPFGARVKSEVIGQTGAVVSETNFVSVIGIDPELDRRVTGFHGWLTEVIDEEMRVANPDRPLDDRADLPSMVISTSRMQREAASIGDRIRLTTGQSSGSRQSESLNFINATFALSGSFSSSYAGFDSLNVFVHIDRMREMLKSPAGSTNEIAIKLLDPDKAEETALRLTNTLKVLDPRMRFTSVRTWKQSNFIQLSSIEHQRSLMQLVLFVIMIVAAFLMYTTLSMMVTEKTGDIGILTAMGGSPLGVSSVFLACGLVIALVGSVLGVVTGCLSSIYLDDFNQWLKASFEIDLFPTRIYNLKSVPYSLDPLWMLIVSAIALMVGLVVSGLPAWRAARLDPLQSLRRD